MQIHTHTHAQVEEEARKKGRKKNEYRTSEFVQPKIVYVPQEQEKQEFFP
jgi:hypothetical protein